MKTIFRKSVLAACLFLAVPLLFTPHYSQAQVTYAISGTVTLAGAGLAGVNMSLTGDVTSATTTDANGDYSFPGLDNGTYIVTPSLAGYTFAPASAPVTISGVDETGVDFVATAVPPDTFAISGTVTLGGAGLAGVSMSLTGDASSMTTTDADGNYSFPGLVNGDYTVTPSLAGYTFAPASAPVTISGADETGVDFVATAIQPGTFTISGTVTLAGAGLAGVTMTLTGDATATTTTDANGDYSFPGLDNGTYTVAPTLAGYTFDPTNTLITISGADETGVDFVATAISQDTYTISGTVRFEGTGLAGVTMTLSGAAHATTTTDANGDYSFPGLDNGGYTVTPSLAGYSFVPPHGQVTVCNADVAGVDFEAVAIPTGPYSISGRVTNLRRAGVAGVTMTLSGAAGATTLTDANGFYSFSGLEAGRYSVKASLNGYKIAPAVKNVHINKKNINGLNFKLVKGLIARILELLRIL